MSTVTPVLGLVKPAGLEQFSRATYNNNLDAIDAGAVVIDTANSTQDWTNFSFLLSTFTRIRVGNKGIVVAHINALVDTAAALPINTATGANYMCVPPGYRPKVTQNYMQSIISGGGRGDEVQCAIDTAGNWYIRSNTGTALTPTVSAVVRTYCVYEWDGIL